MKRLLTFALAAALAISLVACGGGKTKKAFNASKAAYDNVNSAYEIVEDFGYDIYEAWRIGIFDDDQDDFGLAYLAKELNLSEEELDTGLAYALNESDWETMTDSEKEDAIRLAGTYFKLYLATTDSSFSLCVQTVSSAYKANGKVEEVQRRLDGAKEQMREISENYSDYEHYPALKGYYTTTKSFFDFCQNPTGSFEQLKATVEDYKSTARDYKADLDYIFED